MTAHVELRPDRLVITFPGLDGILSLRRRLELPWTEVTSARVAPQRELKADLGWRVGGGYLPGVFATGHYTYRGRPGERQLWCCYRADEVLVVETRRARPRRIVVQVDDPGAVAARIDAVLSGRPTA